MKSSGASSQCTQNLNDQWSLRALHLVLMNITEVLAHELAHPTEAAPEWSQMEWAVARAVASIHGVSPLLAGTLRWQGPDGWSQFLAQQRAHTAARFDRIRELLQQIDQAAAAAEVALLALKGAALYANGVYAPGERPMADVDLLVRKIDVLRTARLLEALGFRTTLRSNRHITFDRDVAGSPAPLGEHCGNAIKIELHCAIRELLPLKAVEISEMIFPGDARPGLNAYSSSTALLVHLLLHAAGAMSVRELRLLHLHDISRLTRSMSEAAWERMFQEAETATGAGESALWWAFPPLTLVSRYFGGVPRKVLSRTGGACHWLLRRACRDKTLSSSSISYLWISAFPAMYWARSTREMLQYATARLVPTRETREQRRELAKTQPRVSGGAWAELSQSRRLLRWVLSRQPRHATLQPVYAALQAAS